MAGAQVAVDEAGLQHMMGAAALGLDQGAIGAGVVGQRIAFGGEGDGGGQAREARRPEGGGGRVVRGLLAARTRGDGFAAHEMFALYHLGRLGREFLIVDGNARIGDNWRCHYEAVRLYSPAKYGFIKEFFGRQKLGEVNGIVAALAIDAVFTALVITLFVLVAEVLAGLTLGRGRQAIRDLLEFLPRTVEVRDLALRVRTGCGRRDAAVLRLRAAPASHERRAPVMERHDRPSGGSCGYPYMGRRPGVSSRPSAV